jgi:two-component system chemotaxis sensor kinase CheA
VSEKPVDLSDFLAGFVAEADEHLGLAGKNLIVLDAELKQGKAHPRAVRELYRSLHTIKGLAAMMGYEPIVAIAHAMETLLRAGDKAAGVLHPSAPDPLVAGLRAIEKRVSALAAGHEVAAAPEDVLEALAKVPPPGAPATDATPAPTAPVIADIAQKLSDGERAQIVAAAGHVARIDFAPSTARSAGGLDITTVRERLGRLGELIKVLPLSRPQTPETPGGLVFAIVLVTTASNEEIANAAGVAPGEVRRLRPPATTTAGSATLAEALAPAVTRSSSSSSSLPMLDQSTAEGISDEGAARRGVVRVEVAKLDDALEKLSALLVTRARLNRAVIELTARGADVRDLSAIVNESGRQLRDLRAAIMSARMISAAEMLERLPLLVRGLQRSTGKQVNLEVDTGQAGLDKSVAEHIFPALVHLVRNAVDHAIESPETRTRAGKPARGNLRVTCRETANNQVQLEVADDGRGLDLRGLAKRAGRELPATEEAVLALLCLPGVSTLDEATATSGRGMGMNIVKDTVEGLGGHLGVETAKGRGTTFTLRVPLSLTIVDAFSFRSGRQAFVVPVALVEEIAEIDPLRITLAPSGKNRAPMRMLERHGTAVPLVSLDHLFHLEADPGPLRKAIIVRRNGRPFGFEIDQMLGHQEVVVRPLEDPLVKQPGIVGSTDLGDGQPTLVLDLVSLSARISRRKSDVRA